MLHPVRASGNLIWPPWQQMSGLNDFCRRLSGYQQPSFKFKMAIADQRTPSAAVGLAAWLQLGLAVQGRLVWRPAQDFAARQARAGARAQLASAGPPRNSNQAKYGCPRCLRSVKLHTSHRRVSQH